MLSDRDGLREHIAREVEAEKESAHGSTLLLRKIIEK